ncbi:23S rRNA (uracil(1939)-C(5))-methyltransferase RlmD [Celerinatantimonas sp. YJH-8]|uniref:23S rRNA (uracil(1939)-C(5))-methyltransferase RlmD n=1 Tax=Celerinatantimonas sp. YJH-8 TaxID=3228714 RepID=UPI0038BF13E9
MVQFYKAKTAAKKTQPVFDSVVSGMDHKLCGIVHHQQNTFFVERVLPGERVRIKPLSNHQGQLIKVLQAGSLRIQPRCEYFQECGGCQSQILTSDQQISFKRTEVQKLIEQLSGYTDLPEPMLITEAAWNYRRCCRLATWYERQQGWLLGFRMAKSKQLVTVQHCDTLNQSLSALIAPLQQLFRQWPRAAGLGHVELIDALPKRVVLVRVTHPLTTPLIEQLVNFAVSQNISLVMDDGINRQWLQGEHCYYEVDDVSLQFEPGDFIQVNASLNQQLVALATDWLDPQPQERILDLYSGIGNFTLPLAKRAAHVTAIEGVASMAVKVQQNAQANGLNNVEAVSGDLNDPAALRQHLTQIDKVLLDPARAGAKTALGLVAKARPKAVVYIACDPATMARDIAQLYSAGYQFKRWALIDMFAQTSHVETAVLFTVA